MPVVAGGWTADAVTVDYLDQSGQTPAIFKGMVQTAIKSILSAKEVAGTLTTAEKALRDSGDYCADRAIEFIKADSSGKFASRGYYMPGGDITSVLNTQWANILKRYS